MAARKKPAASPEVKPTARKPRTSTPKVKAHLEKVRPVAVTLQFEHSINGHNYGPGEVKVKPSVARLLMEQEQRVLHSENRVNEHRNHMVVASRFGPPRKYTVASDIFESLLSRTPEGMMLIL